MREPIIALNTRLKKYWAVTNGLAYLSLEVNEIKNVLRCPWVFIGAVFTLPKFFSETAAATCTSGPALATLGDTTQIEMFILSHLSK
jgi:hypothetical protein